MSKPMSIGDFATEEETLQEMAVRYRLNRAKNHGTMWEETYFKYLVRFPKTQVKDKQGLRDRVRYILGLSSKRGNVHRQKTKGTNAESHAGAPADTAPEPIEESPESATAADIMLLPIEEVPASAMDGKGLVSRVNDLESRCAIFARRINVLSQILDGAKTDSVSPAN